MSESFPNPITVSEIFSKGSCSNPVLIVPPVVEHDSMCDDPDIENIKTSLKKIWNEYAEQLHQDNSFLAKEINLLDHTLSTQCKGLATTILQISVNDKHINHVNYNTNVLTSIRRSSTPLIKHKNDTADEIFKTMGKAVVLRRMMKDYLMGCPINPFDLSNRTKHSNSTEYSNHTMHFYNPYTGKKIGKYFSSAPFLNSKIALKAYDVLCESNPEIMLNENISFNDFYRLYDDKCDLTNLRLKSKVESAKEALRKLGYKCDMTNIHFFMYILRNELHVLQGPSTNTPYSCYKDYLDRLEIHFKDAGYARTRSGYPLLHPR